MRPASQGPFRLGMFVMPIHNPAKPLAQCFDEDLELAVRCEQLGFDEFWVGEHHTSTLENIVMPEIFIAKAFGLTKTMRFGPAPVCLQYHHPVHVANRLAFLDHLSHGRLNLCFGAGAIPTDMEVYGVDPKDVAARIGEAVDLILRIWTSDPPYELPGQFWNVSLSKHVDAEMGLGALHKPLQKPYPPIAVPSISRRSAGIEKAAARGFSLFSHHMIAAQALIEQWATYRSAAVAAGRHAAPADWRVARNIFVADTTAEARRRRLPRRRGLPRHRPTVSRRLRPVRCEERSRRRSGIAISPLDSQDRLHRRSHLILRRVVVAAVVRPTDAWPRPTGARLHLRRP